MFELPDGMNPEDPTTPEMVSQVLAMAFPTVGQLFGFFRSSFLKVKIADLQVQIQRNNEEAARQAAQVQDANALLVGQIEALKAEE